MNHRFFGFHAGLSAGLLFVALHSGAAGAENQTLTKEKYIGALSEALDVIARKSASVAKGRQVPVHANLFLAHEAFIAATPIEVLERAVDALQEAGVAQVDLNMGLFPWLTHDQPAIEKYDRIVARIRARGMKVAVNPQYSTVRHKVSSLEEWGRIAVPIFREIAARYHPDVFVVVHEPSTMAARMGERKSTPAQWVEFARVAAAVVHEVSPQSRIGAGGLPAEEDFFKAFARMPAIDVLTLDIYDLKSLPVCGALIRLAHQERKAVYIEETWRPPFYQPQPGQTLEAISAKSVGDGAFAGLDGQWMRTLALWAAAQELDGITPVWIQTFFAYGGEGTEAFDPDYLRRVMAAISQGQRTETFRALREIATQPPRKDRK